MNNLSFRNYLKMVEAKSPEYQDLASRLMGIDPEDREGQVYLGADVQDGKKGWNVVPMAMGKAIKKNGKVIGNELKLMTNLPGQRTVRRFTQKGDKWVDMGREDSPNRSKFMPAKAVDNWINQGAAQGGGVGMGGPVGL